MSTSRLIGIAVLVIVWLWLAWFMLKHAGVTLYNLLLVGMTGIIIFVPLYKKYCKKK